MKYLPEIDINSLRASSSYSIPLWKLTKLLVCACVRPLSTAHPSSYFDEPLMPIKSETTDAVILFEI